MLGHKVCSSAYVTSGHSPLLVQDMGDHGTHDLVPEWCSFGVRVSGHEGENIKRQKGRGTYSVVGCHLRIVTSYIADIYWKLTSGIFVEMQPIM